MLQLNTFIDSDGTCALVQKCCQKKFYNGDYLRAGFWSDCATGYSYSTNNECSSQRSPISMSACALCDLRLFAMLGIWRVKHFTCCACLFMSAQSRCYVFRWRFSCWLDLLNVAQYRAEPERTGDIISGIFVCFIVVCFTLFERLRFQFFACRFMHSKLYSHVYVERIYTQSEFM